MPPHAHHHAVRLLFLVWLFFPPLTPHTHSHQPTVQLSIALSHTPPGSTAYCDRFINRARSNALRSLSFSHSLVVSSVQRPEKKASFFFSATHESTFLFRHDHIDTLERTLSFSLTSALSFQRSRASPTPSFRTTLHTFFAFLNVFARLSLSSKDLQEAATAYGSTACHRRSRVCCLQLLLLFPEKVGPWDGTGTSRKDNKHSRSRRQAGLEKNALVRGRADRSRRVVEHVSISERTDQERVTLGTCGVLGWWHTSGRGRLWDTRCP